ncbi:MAG: 4Fe-4S dicluster domain-containing protein [Deltaproteobacteria bacterium]|nr:4Fe-4S dicluster domain-containing protein [Deltaproteobacteria bacterium]
MPDRVRDELLAIATKLFDEGKVDYFLGYKKGTVKFKTTPLIARSREDLPGLWVEDFFASNLSLYLKEIKSRVAILVKGCDSRSLISLLKEGQIRREDLYIVGLPCPGQIDPGRVADAAGCEREELEEITRRDGEILVRVGSQEKTVPKNQTFLDKCLDCQHPQPLIFDYLLPGDYAAPVQELTRSKDELRQKQAPERWAFWAEQFQRCIRCYACRNVCPACFCPRCIVEENMPQWVSALPTAGDNFVFHLMRLMHVAGTCVSCGECERVCPMEIPLMKLQDKMADDLRELFDFVAGVDLDKPLPFRTYRQEDPNDFIK